MKEKLYTIPLIEAFQADDECPFCYIENKLEQDALDFTLGACSSYMESDIREQTDHMGFCRHHFKKMYQYGNSLGNALILKTHIKKINQELEKQLEKYAPEKQTFLNKLKKPNNLKSNQLAEWMAQKESTCFVCDYIQNTYNRYLDTFFYLFMNQPEFIEHIKHSKGFCLHHFGEVTNLAASKLNQQQHIQYTQVVFPIMKNNMARMEQDISWLVDKYDYRNADADWKNSRDALQRGMQKLKGGYPAEKSYQGNR
ncbi:hypothetical protein C8E03_105207 [Lachnotalea glycerini]|uniref:ABC transporter substrate-binding protein n=1 Tax=Lachnotalea glycerini TaxID=1763509 RepID=A0A255IT18_9FIRM|nr:DUF6062 family protein [Lachnotalea glycerini]OYO43001.1 hypothetical protein CG709_20720 [Lachnotalea glycerini]PXV90297.1 hypothetical protein C8E03_105207 [Lachnotalea glycerini]RDY31049.1 hypothetical protein CG710_011765 [Lachnotalea glycerini]